MVINPHSLRVGISKDWDSKWYPEEYIDENLLSDEVNHKHFSISSKLIQYSLWDRKIHLVQLLGKNKYQKITNKIKSLSR